MDTLTELRAALIQLEKSLQTQRACVLRIISVIEHEMKEEEKPIAVTISKANELRVGSIIKT